MTHEHLDQFVPINIAVLTVSDSRTEETDTSGRLLVDRLTNAGHRLAERTLLADNLYQVRALVSRWIAEEQVDAVIITGGTGLTDRDITPEAVLPLFDKQIEGFGELFRHISYEAVQTSTIQSRALAGVANGTFIFCLPGSTGACRTAWDQILGNQLDGGYKPCNFVELMPRMYRK